MVINEEDDSVLEASHKVDSFFKPSNNTISTCASRKEGEETSRVSDLAD